MKKIAAVFITLCVVASLAACTGSNSPQKETNVNDTASSSAQEVDNKTQATDNTQKSKDETFGLNDTAVFDNIKITALDLEESNGTEFFQTEDGKVFVGIKFEIENVSEETENISSLLLFNAYADDVKCDYSFSANAVFDDGTLDGELSPGKKLSGWYAVEIPQGWQQLELEVKSEWLSNNKAKFVFEK